MVFVEAFLVFTTFSVVSVNFFLLKKLFDGKPIADKYMPVYSPFPTRFGYTRTLYTEHGKGIK